MGGSRSFGGPSPAALALGLAVLAIGVINLTVGDLTWWGECLSVWPSAGWLMLLAPRLGLWLYRGQRRDALFVGGLTLLLIVVTGEWRSLGRPTTSEPGAGRGLSSFRVVSWNVAGGMPLDDLASDRPDLVLMQEIGAMPPPAERSTSFADFEWLADFDPGTFSRTPITRLPTRRVGPWQEPQVIRTEIGGRTLIVFNVRLALPAFVVAVASLEPPSRLVELHRERIGQFTKLGSLIADTLAATGSRSALLCGDFNSPGGIQSSAPLRSVLRDVWPEGGAGWGATMPSWLPLSRIDQCWATPDLEVLQAVVRKGVSDHRRLVVDLAFR